MKKLFNFIFKEWNEFLSIPLGFLLFFTFPYVLRLFDSTSAAYDGGVLHAYIAAIVGMLLIHGFVWVLLKITFPKLYRFFDTMFEEYVFSKNSFMPTLTERDKHLTLSTWHKCVLSLAYFSVLLIGTVLLANLF